MKKTIKHKSASFYSYVWHVPRMNVKERARRCSDDMLSMHAFHDYGSYHFGIRHRSHKHRDRTRTVFDGGEKAKQHALIAIDFFSIEKKKK